MPSWPNATSPPLWPLDSHAMISTADVGIELVRRLAVDRVARDAGRLRLLPVFIRRLVLHGPVPADVDVAVLGELGMEAMP